MKPDWVLGTRRRRRGEERVQLSDVIMTDEIDWTLTHRNVEHFRNMLVFSYNEDAPSGEW